MQVHYANQYVITLINTEQVVHRHGVQPDIFFSEFRQDRGKQILLISERYANYAKRLVRQLFDDYEGRFVAIRFACGEFLRRNPAFAHCDRSAAAADCGVVADGVLGPDRVEAPGRHRAACFTFACGRRLVVDAVLRLVGLDASDHEENDDDYQD